MAKEIEEQEVGNATSFFKEAMLTLIWAVVIATFVRTLGWEPFNIPSGSMKPTLLVGDYLFVSKYSYGYSRHSLPWSLPILDGRILASPPERGDVVVFKLPSDNETDYIKRIIGLPGDRIQVLGGILHINDKAVQREKQDVALGNNSYGMPVRATQYVETLPNGRQHLIWEESDSARLDNTAVFHVPPGHYFAMGDNRDNSLDSREQSSVGFIPDENLVGRAGIIFFSHDGTAEFYEVWKWLQAIRFSRLVNGIE